MKDIRKVIGLLLCMTICCYMTGEEKKNLNIVFIWKQHNAKALCWKIRDMRLPL